MANVKQYASWVDIPDGNGGYERKYLRDDDAQGHLADLDEQTAALQAATASVTYNGKTYTLQTIMAEMAKLIDETVIVQTPES